MTPGVLFRKSRAVAVVALGNLVARWPRALVALVAVALGVALVSAITSGYASARQTILDWNYSWVGHSHVHLQPIPDGLWSDPRIPPDLAGQIAAEPGVRMVARQKEYLLATTAPDAEPLSVYGYGIQLPGEQDVRGAGIRLETGRMLSGRAGEAMIERHLADTLKVGLGDTVRLAARPESLRRVPIEVNLGEVDVPAVLRPAQAYLQRLLRSQRTSAFRVVGIITRPRFSTVSSQQGIQLRDLVMVSQDDLGRLFGGQALGFESADLILAHSGPRQMAATADRVRATIRTYMAERAHATTAPAGAFKPVNIQVETSDDKLAQIDKNMRLFRLISRTVSVVALLTASYIIFTTLGMGMVQRQVELGMLRCVGAGRVQVAAATFAEALPIALAGIALGVVAGVAAARGVIEHYRGFFTQMVISYPGLLWAAVGGFVAVMLAVALPAWMASRVSPLAASRPQSRRMPLRLDVALGCVGVALVGLSFLTRMWLWPGESPDTVMTTYLLVGVPALFLGYFLAAPLLVATLGGVLKYFAAALLLVRPRLLDDQMQTARWRTAATFCALMVGISMLVNLRVHSESIIRGWQLPTQMPPGFVFFFGELDREQLARVTALPQVRTPTPLMAFWVRYLPPDAADRAASAEVKFLSGPLTQMSQLIQLNFVESADADPARTTERVARGQGVLVTREFATRYHARMGDPVRLYREQVDPLVELPIVGIVESPTLDMAIDFLNVRDRFQSLSAGTIIGNVASANRILMHEGGSATQPQPPGESGDSSLPLRTRILLFDFANGEAGPAGQRAQLQAIGKELNGMHLQYYAGSLVELREMIVGEFRGVVSILQKIALWAMAIASLGVGFSMAANVHSRRRQLAVLRAIGMTRFQLSRQVLAEAVIIALLGSVAGLVHGLHLSINALYFDRVLFDFRPELTLPLGVLAVAIGFAVACCLVASLIPAMRAGRTNILAAMRQL